MGKYTGSKKRQDLLDFLCNPKAAVQNVKPVKTVKPVKGVKNYELFTVKASLYDDGQLRNDMCTSYKHGYIHYHIGKNNIEEYYDLIVVTTRDNTEFKKIA